MHRGGRVNLEQLRRNMEMCGSRRPAKWISIRKEAGNCNSTNWPWTDPPDRDLMQALPERLKRASWP